MKQQSGWSLLASEDSPGEGVGRFCLRHRGIPRRTGRMLATSTGSSRHRLEQRLPGGFSVDDFTVDHAAGTATCPDGLTRTMSRTGYAIFGAACADCPLRARCTRSRTG